MARNEASWELPAQEYPNHGKQILMQRPHHSSSWHAYWCPITSTFSSHSTYPHLQLHIPPHLSYLDPARAIIIQCSQQREYILLFGTNFVYNFKITSSKLIEMYMYHNLSWLKSPKFLSSHIWHAQGDGSITPQPSSQKYLGLNCHFSKSGS